MDSYTRNARSVSNVERHLRRYLALGWSLIPLEPAGNAKPGQKPKPRVRWERYQHKAANAEQVLEWLARWPDSTWAVVTGKVSGIVGVDIDNADEAHEALQSMPMTAIARTAKGRHYYLRCPDDALGCAVKPVPGLDIRGEGGYLIVPPSLHPSGVVYDWVVPPEEGFADFDSGFLRKLRAKMNTGDGVDKLWRSNILGAAEGERNATATSYCGRVLKALPMSMWMHAWALVENWNAGNAPPLDPQELATTFKSIMRKEAQRRERDGEVEADTSAMQALPISQAARIGEVDTQWIIDDFIPAASLAMIFGEGGVGKSTMNAYIASIVTRRKQNVLFVGAGEELFERWAPKVLAVDPHAAKYLRAYNGPPLVLPQMELDFEDLLLEHKFSLVIFDAWRSTMEQSMANEADRTRRVLTSISRIIGTTGATVICLSHPPRSDPMRILGSVEVENVARAALRMSANKNDPHLVQLKVTKMNFDKPKTVLEARIESTILRDGHTGRIQWEQRVNGSRRKERVGVIFEHSEVEENIFAGVLDEAREKRNLLIRDLASVGLSGNAIYKKVGGHRAEVLALVKSLQDAS